MSGATGWEKGEGQLPDNVASFRGDENVLELAVMVAKLLEFIHNHWTVPLRWVNCMVYELDFNKATNQRN